MNEKLVRNLLVALLFAVALTGAYAMINFLEVNRIRADEFLSFLHSDPAFHPHAGQVWKNIAEGADNSYTHAVLLQQWFLWFGSSIVSQRALSLFFWLLGGLCLWVLLNELDKPVVHKWLFWIMIQFGNMGFLLANDGRFYSMVYTCSLLVLLCIIRFIRSASWLWMAALSAAAFISLLTSALSSVNLVLVMVALVLLLVRKLISLSQLLSITIAVILPMLIYFSVFKIDAFHHHFSTWLFSKPTADALPLSEFISTPFRFILMMDIPGLPDVAGVLVTGLLLLLLFYFSRQGTSSNNVVFFLFNELFLLLVVLFVAQLAASFMFHWPLWPYRYYAGLFWIIPLWFYQHTHLQASPKAALVALMLCLGFGGRAVDELQKIAGRKKEIPIPVSGNTIYIEQFENYKTLSRMGEQYIRYPFTRANLVLKLDSNSVQRNAYFRLIQKQGDDLQTTQ